MIHVLLDSSIYRGDPLRRRLAFATLTALCEKKLVVLHVPTIVKREFTTNLVLEAETILVEAVRSLNRLRRSVDLITRGPLLKQAGKSFKHLKADTVNIQR